MTSEHIHFVTGRLAEHALCKEVEAVAATAGFAHTIEVLPITVAALMTPAWIAQRMNVPPEANRVIIPGYCEGDLTPLTETSSAKVERGPRDLRMLAEYFGQQVAARDEYGDYDIEILAEINHAPRRSR